MEALIKDEKSPFFRNVKTVMDEKDHVSCYIASLTKEKVEDSKPVHIGVSILQWSKYIFIEFMYFLEMHLMDGSFKTCYADTDSMALALTKTDDRKNSLKDRLKGMFDPIVKPSMKSSWDSKWENWFVSTEETWDIRRPGKLKGSCNMSHSICVICVMYV